MPCINEFQTKIYTSAIEHTQLSIFYRNVDSVAPDFCFGCWDGMGWNGGGRGHRWNLVLEST